MTLPSKFSFYVVVAILSLAAGFAYKSRQINNSLYMTSEQKQEGAEAFFNAALTDVAGVVQPGEQWRGKIIVANFWATWCAPCRDEIPELIDTYASYRDQGIIVVGIAVDDTQKVAAFSEEFGINYPIVVGEFDAFTLAEAMGNPQGALPFTATIDRSGNIINTHLGRIKKKQIEEIIRELL
ncbi:MAG: TlpA disulfide reductase family protein [Nitrosomonas sp.]|jgi:thiol-disulfide isomerase/thioredoxin|nr:TlpA family protein disulfide reductase [Nitrosomonas sp.]MCC7135985.1 TlpA family protein disulfide reductase [Nitrosomonas sp.]